jgi:hypothetical protein
MITQVDRQLREQAQRFNLRFCCEHCVAFDPVRAACAHSYPNEAHLAVDLSQVQQVVFCKEFEVA